MELDRVEREIRGARVEEAFAFSVDGKLLFHATDDAVAHVTFGDTHFGLLAGAVLTHNHPGGRSFSENDVMLAMHARVAEMRVVTSATRYVLHPPEGGWSGFVRMTLPAVLKAERYLLERQLFREIASGDRSLYDADLAFHHLLCERLSRRGLVRYRTEPW